MKRCLSALACALLLVALLCPLGSAVTDQALDAQIKDYLHSRGLNRENFSLSYLNVETGNVVNYNADVFLPVGSAWILPLHMYYYKMETTGVLEDTLEIGQEVYTINGLTLQQCRFRSITLGEQEIAEVMRENLGELRAYLELINSEFAVYDPLDLPQEYWTGEHYSAKYLTACLSECIKHPEYYPQMLQAFREVQTSEGFADYSASAQSFETIKLRGEQDGWICETASIGTTSPFLITVFITQQVAQSGGGSLSGDAILVELRELISEYLEELAGVESEHSESAPGRERADSALIATTNVAERTSRTLKYIGLALAAAAVLAGVIGLIYYLLRRYHNRDYDDF